MSLRTEKCSNEKGGKSPTLSFFRCERTGSSHFFYQINIKEIPHFENHSRLWNFIHYKASPEVINTNLPCRSMHLLKKCPDPFASYFILPSVFPLISLPDAYLFSKTFDVTCLPDSVISIFNNRAHCWDAPFLVNTYISVIEKLCNCLSLSLF